MLRCRAGVSSALKRCRTFFMISKMSLFRVVSCRLCTQFAPSHLGCAWSCLLPFCFASEGKFVTGTCNTMVPVMVMLYVRGLVELSFGGGVG